MKINNLSKTISRESGFQINLINNLSFEIEKGTITTLLAPFGSGKTTLLKIIAGLEASSQGEVILSPHKKTVYIPSNPSSLPWFNVNENFSLVTQKQELKNEIIRLVGLEGYENHLPAEKSKGFRFLISLGMALLSGADLMLIDDPFADLTDPMKEKVFNVISGIKKVKNTSFIIATSNLSDALVISDKIALLKKNPLSLIEMIPLSYNSERDLKFLNSEEAGRIKNQIIHLYSVNNIDKVINLSI